jgi:phage terminase small subunit
MTNFTQRQQAYIENRASGLKQKQAAIAAGYSAATAEKQAGNMERQATIKSAIAKAKRDKGKPATEEEPVFGMPKSHYTDSKEFLIDIMNHKMLPLAARAEYAKALLPYQHARIAEKSKKDDAKDKAIDLAGGGTKHKFSKKTPPRERQPSIN